MNRVEFSQNALVGLVVAVMLGVLAFLYNKTQAVDLGEQNEVMRLLSEVKEIDTRWDLEVQRLQDNPRSATDRDGVRVNTGDKALRDITRFAQLTNSKMLSGGLTELRATIQQKSDWVQQFKDEQGKNKIALQNVMDGIKQLKLAPAAQKNSHAEVSQSLNLIEESVLTYVVEGKENQALALHAATQELQKSAVGKLPQADMLMQGVEALLANVPSQHALFAKLAILTTGPRLTSMNMAFNNELEKALQEKELYRIYLVYYAAALLVLLGYLGVKLKSANQSLEHRVEERTRDLSNALMHLKESEAQLIQSEKMSSLGQMVAGVAHEINTPLAYVKNSLGRVSEQMPNILEVVATFEHLLAQLKAGNDSQGLSDTFQKATSMLGSLKQHHALDELDGLVKDGLFGTQQVAEIVSNLKDFSRLDRSKVTHFNLNDGLNSTLMLGKHLLKSVSIDKQFGDIPEITCSPSQINQVFLNLVTNAVQAMPDERGALVLTTKAEADGVAVVVQDNGKGIPPEVIKKIFDPFFTTKEIGKGTGLGLSISFKIVQQHGGNIKVESKPGVGTKFTVWLPLNPPADAHLEG